MNICQTKAWTSLSLVSISFFYLGLIEFIISNFQNECNFSQYIITVLAVI